ncbi:MAG: type I-E CRISPR-associated protein Cas6/Cse3/CasE [Chloroflexi bacterium]|nr:type I-E CRISPR-associated protein Cas6/Cse3/CasE [Chloroflexota bacterium]
MYLSRLQLNSANRQVWRNIIANPYKVHQMVMRGFFDDVKREKGDVLHRLDIRDWGATLLVQSTLKPDWSPINPDYLLPVDPLPNPAVKQVDLPLQVGQALSFRLVANPTLKKVRRNENGERLNSNRVPLLREEEQINWLQKRAETAGFKLLSAAISQSQSQKIWKQKGAKPITLYTVQFDGYLEVIQPDNLLAAIKSGIGPSKAFGCGLLSLARA